MFSFHNEHKPKKSLGQNFLKDLTVIDQIIKTINLQKDQIIVEIGPGLGAITKDIVDNCYKLIVIEIDVDLSLKLQHQFKEQIINQKLQIINRDVLQVDFNSIAQDLNNNSQLRIVGNLPYNISTPLLFKLFSYDSFIKDLHFLLQKEVAERLVALPNSKKYGRLSIMSQYYSIPQIMFNVRANAFDPIPKVESCFVKIIPHKDLPYKAVDHNFFYKIVTTAFSQRRKIISNALKKYCTIKNLELLGINPNNRPEQISVVDFVKISNFILN